MSIPIMMNWFLTVLQAITAPLGLRFTTEARPGNMIRATVTWSNPLSWGDDSQGTGTRDFRYIIRRLFRADGTRDGSVIATSVQGASDFDHFFDGAVNSIYQFEVRAENANTPSDRSAYSVVDIPMILAEGFLMLDNRPIALDTSRRFVLT